MDARVKTWADVASEHHLLVGRCCLQLKTYPLIIDTSSQKTSHKYHIEMQKDGEINNKFKLTSCPTSTRHSPVSKKVGNIQGKRRAERQSTKCGRVRKILGGSHLRKCWEESLNSIRPMSAQIL